MTKSLGIQLWVIISRFNELLKLQLLGTEERSRVSTEKNQIRVSLLEFIEKIPNKSKVNSSFAKTKYSDSIIFDSTKPEPLQKIRAKKGNQILVFSIFSIATGVLISFSFLNLRNHHFQTLHWKIR